MKYLAENIFMLQTKINAEIDESIKQLKVRKGQAGVIPLVIVLEKTDIGSRVMSESTQLKGEDWRKTREKMHKQDDLEHVLANLDGDNINKDLLRTRYKDFRQHYDQLLSQVLANSKEKDKALQMLVGNTRLLVAKVIDSTPSASAAESDTTTTSVTIKWSLEVKEIVSELLANIFAIWTLQNTQYYNASRGIEADKFYLLMPHVGQVIAIFRILGIGYKRQTKPAGFVDKVINKATTMFSTLNPFSIANESFNEANHLFNNLVQVGTGEGKSVILGVTACVFALLGVDVSCSCYSDYLSSRDKSDFNSVFSALGVEERISYGTFNKLCEDLLNQQCNVRETVRDLIENNKSSIEAAVTHKKQPVRPKVLLIDEVDVFLSDQFYGGLYRPSLVIKEASIKRLLDEIWEGSKATRLTFNVVRAMSTYKACALKYRYAKPIVCHQPSIVCRLFFFNIINARRTKF